MIIIIPGLGRTRPSYGLSRCRREGTRIGRRVPPTYSVRSQSGKNPTTPATSAN